MGPVKNSTNIIKCHPYTRSFTFCYFSAKTCCPDLKQQILAHCK